VKRIKTEDSFDNITIHKNASIINTLKKMDALHRKLLMVIENNKFFSLISIGDIQRAIIANIPLENSIESILRKEVKTGSVNDSDEHLKALMLEYRMEFLPIVDESQTIRHIYFWEDFFESVIPKVKKSINVPVVIMAGGEGRRLKPLTNVIPKPLVPFADKTIIEKILDNFVETGCNNFYLSINYKAGLIRHFFTELANPHYNISYFQESKPLGTAGSLSLLKDVFNETFFISNCDIIIEQDYSEIYDFHKINNYDITVVAAMKHVLIPYGIIETEENGKLFSLIEKPELTFKINSGFYLVEPKVLAFIPSDTIFHFTDLINKVREINGKIGVFPVSRKSWVDIGTWQEYLYNQSFTDNK
jgi:dTDP-glucose pyrophosphorylase